MYLCCFASFINLLLMFYFNSGCSHSDSFFLVLFFVFPEWKFSHLSPQMLELEFQSSLSKVGLDLFSSHWSTHIPNFIMLSLSLALIIMTCDMRLSGCVKPIIYFLHSPLSVCLSISPTPKYIFIYTHRLETHQVYLICITFFTGVQLIQVSPTPLPAASQYARKLVFCTVYHQLYHKCLSVAQSKAPIQKCTHCFLCSF